MSVPTSSTCMFRWLCQRHSQGFIWNHLHLAIVAYTHTTDGEGRHFTGYIRKRAMSTTQDICWLSESYPVLMLGMLPNKEGKMNLEK